MHVYIIHHNKIASYIQLHKHTHIFKIGKWRAGILSVWQEIILTKYPSSFSGISKEGRSAGSEVERKRNETMQLHRHS